MKIKKLQWCMTDTVISVCYSLSMSVHDLSLGCAACVSVINQSKRVCN